MKKRPRPPSPPASGSSPISDAFARQVNRLRPQANFELQRVDEPLRGIIAGSMAMQAMAVILGCPVRDTVPYLAAALRPGEHLVAGHDLSPAERLSALTVNACAFCYLMRAGHQPDALLAAIEDGLWLDWNLGNAPDCLGLFQAAAHRHRFPRPS